MDIRFTRTARRHRVGKARVLAVMDAQGDPLVVTSADGHSVEFWWFGVDQRGVEIEIMAVERADCWLVVHAMPTHYHRRRQGGE